MGQSPPGSSYNFDGKGLPLLNGPTEFGEIFPIPKQWTTSSRVVCEKNDLLICVRGNTTGKMNWADQRYSIGRGLATVRPFDSQLDIRFLYYFLRAKTTELNQHTFGSTFPNLTGNKLRAFELPLPPIITQGRIVQKLDRIIDKIELMKRSVLKLQNQMEMDLYILYNKILAERFSTLIGLKGDRKSWETKRLEDICVSISSGFAEGNKNVEDGIIHLRMNNIGINFEINLDLVRRVKVWGVKLAKYKLEYGDILFNNTNSVALVGKSAIFTKPEICLYSNHLTRLRPKKKEVLSEWILFYLRARWLKGDFRRLSNKWINQAAVHKEKIKDLEIPMPPLDVQFEIVKDLQKTSFLISKTSDNRKTIIIRNRQTETELELLSNRILDYAFTGRLVDQDSKPRTN